MAADNSNGERNKKERERLRKAAYYVANKAKFKERSAVYYAKNKKAYRERSKRWISENSERAKQWWSGYYLSHKEVYRERERSYYAKNPDRFRSKAAAERANHPERVRARVRKWRAKNFHVVVHHNALRRTRQMMATPQWADLDAIKTLYREATRLRKETGTAWHVDHQIPLKHPLVCGLHVHTNLRVVLGAENQSKGNKFDGDC